MEHYTQYAIKVSARTWSRDSHGLFDYESSSITTDDLLISSPCFLALENSHIRVSSEPGLLEISEWMSSFSISSPELWSVVRGSRRLKEGDIIKLGRVKLLVKELKVSEEDEISAQTQDSSEDEDLEVTQPKGQCRICLCEDYTEENPLLAPCNCIGSVQFIHLECLQRWLDSKKVVKESEDSVSSYWKSLGCEICKEPFPFNLSVKGKDISLLQKETIPSPYIVFEVLNQGALHAISLMNRCTAKVGRGHDSDARIPDISVSRVHANLSFRDGDFYLEDNNSKFGSLVLERESLQVSHEPTWVQIGRSVFSISLGD